ncbi:MAG: hypothetical protein KME25_01685 [Symplocastrum torsivum CPER-KK1]|uniref:Uncharacterized protein n=1 Tax=Symplocastrum torsivum CPER-KK1 TaxID=450513 RepID=A0A951U7X3_9CYAN|nr:hypothetical protein [Symplocastrum torsivum CPER-KK1]
MFRKLTIILISLSLCWTTLACSTPNSSQSYGNPNNTNRTTSAAPTRVSDGRYPVQQATYDDVNGEYTLMLLNTQPGTPPTFRTTDLQMARLTNEEIAAGQKSYLNVENGQPALHLTEDFKIEYVHNVTENQVNPQTGQQETVVVRQQSSFWTPFAGALAGQAVGSLLFSPRYYVPPVYQPGVIMTGYGGYGNTYGQAVQQYQTRYQAPPPAVKNSQSFRTTGRLRTPSSSQRTTVRRVPQTGTRSTGSGYGSSTLRRSNQPSSTGAKRSPSFGSSSRRSSPSRAPSSFGSRKRR